VLNFRKSIVQQDGEIPGLEQAVKHKTNENTQGILFEIFESFYLNNGIARKLCDLLPEISVKQQIQFQVPNSGNEFLLDERTHNKLESVIFEATCLARLYGSVFVFPFQENTNEKEDYPLQNTKFHFVRPDHVLSNRDPDTITFTVVDDVMFANKTITAPREKLFKVNSELTAPIEWRRFEPYTNPSVLLANLENLSLYEVILTSLKNHCDVQTTQLLSVKDLTSIEDPQELFRSIQNALQVKRVTKVIPIDSEDEFSVISIRYEDIDTHMQVVQKQISAAANLPMEVLFSEQMQGFTISNGEIPFPMRLLEKQVIAFQQHIKNTFTTFVSDLLDQDFEITFENFLKQSEVQERQDRLQIWEKMKTMTEAQQMPLETFLHFTKHLLNLDDILEENLTLDANLNLISNKKE
jgi:hypothetical protein